MVHRDATTQDCTFSLLLLTPVVTQWIVAWLPLARQTPSPVSGSVSLSLPPSICGLVPSCGSGVARAQPLLATPRRPRCSSSKNEKLFDALSPFRSLVPFLPDLSQV